MKHCTLHNATSQCQHLFLVATGYPFGVFLPVVLHKTNFFFLPPKRYINTAFLTVVRPCRKITIDLLDQHHPYFWCTHQRQIASQFEHFACFVYVAPSKALGSKFKFQFGSTCATRCRFLGALPKF